MNLELFAKKIRYYTLKELHNMGFGHYGGSLSIVECLAVLYGEEMNVYPTEPKNPDRDYFILSKGHGGPALYATLFLKGYFSEDWLYTLNKNGTLLPSHPDAQKTPGVDLTTGSLGQGISGATGIAKGNQLLKKDNYTYVIVGDGELNEGQCWEAFQFAAHHKLENFIVFIDENKKQLDGPTCEICCSQDFVKKMEAFGFYSLRVDGKSVTEIQRAVEKVKKVKGCPKAIILDTIKGQGVSLIEEMGNNHHLRPSREVSESIYEEIVRIGNELILEGEAEE